MFDDVVVDDFVALDFDERVRRAADDLAWACANDLAGVTTDHQVDLSVGGRAVLALANRLDDETIAAADLADAIRLRGLVETLTRGLPRESVDRSIVAVNVYRQVVDAYTARTRHTV